MSPGYAVELLKLRRSRVVLVATAALVVAPASMARAFVLAAERGGNDPTSLKAMAMLPGSGWERYLGGLAQIYATAGLLGVGIVVGWSFGREYADRTVASLYASATPRGSVARAKLVLLAGWASGAGVLVVLVALALGLATGLGPPNDLAWEAAGRMAVLAVLSGLSALPVALAASLGRGYLPAVGGLLLLVVLAQAATIAGVGGWWPWSVPALWALGANTGQPVVETSHLLLTPTVALLAALAVERWWKRSQVC